MLSGERSETRINDACRRVLEMKGKIGLFSEGYKCCGGGIREEQLECTNKVNKEIAKNNITLVTNQNKMIPLDKNKIKKGRKNE